MSKTVLVVDDERLILHLVKSILETQGMTVRVATSGPAALDLVAQNPCVDLLVTDFLMPDMDGAELASRVLKVSPRTRVLFMSAHCGEVSRVAPDYACVAKPFTVQDLLARVRDALEAVDGLT
jgi:CheY-like chemotaxis protein